MRTRTPAKVTHARPANVESIRVGKRPFVTIGGAVEKNYSGLSGNRYARDRNFGGQVPRETLSRGVPAHAFLDRGIDQSPVIAQRLTLLRMQPEGIHEIGEEVIDGSAAGEQDCHHVGDDLFLRKVRALLSSGNQHREEIVAARVFALAELGFQKGANVGRHCSGQWAAHRAVRRVKKARHQFAAPKRGFVVEAEHPAEGSVQERPPQIGDLPRMLAETGLHCLDSRRRKTLEHDAP